MSLPETVFMDVPFLVFVRCPAMGEGEAARACYAVPLTGVQNVGASMPR
jgi:hypothetical protein